jgi:hypothetical protein
LKDIIGAVIFYWQIFNAVFSCVFFVFQKSDGVQTLVRRKWIKVWTSQKRRATVGAEFPEKGAKEFPRGELSSQKEIREESKQRSDKN